MDFDLLDCKIDALDIAVFEDCTRDEDEEDDEDEDEDW